MNVARATLDRFKAVLESRRDFISLLPQRRRDVASIWGLDLAGDRKDRSDVVADDLVFLINADRKGRTGVAATVQRIAAERTAEMDEAWWTRSAETLALVQLQTGAAALMSDASFSGAPNIVAALVLSHALAINVANVDAQWSEQHVVLSAAAWLGLLHRGRPALLPKAIAQVFTDLRKPSAIESDAAEALAVLVELQGRDDRILATADAVAGDGVARCVFPSATVNWPVPSRLAALRAAVRARGAVAPAR